MIVSCGAIEAPMAVLSFSYAEKTCWDNSGEGFELPAPMLEVVEGRCWVAGEGLLL